MEEFATAVMGEKGRIVIPAAMRHKAGLKPGDPVFFSLDGHSLNLFTLEGRMKRSQAMVRKSIRPGVSLSKELLKERREEAKREYGRS
jgi:AbrB family looped-hinge helix DNA binding protein